MVGQGSNYIAAHVMRQWMHAYIHECMRVCLGKQPHSNIYMISQLYLYLNEYGVVVLVGFMFATIIIFYIV